MFSSKWFAVAVTCALIVTGCQPAPPTQAELTGTWLQMHDGHQQGFLLHADGQLSLLGIANAQGKDWHYDAASGAITLTTTTALQDSPIAYRIESFSSAELTLKSDGILDGIFRRADNQVAVISGQVSYRQRSALPPSAVLNVVLNDVSLADAPAKQMAVYQVALAGRQVPIPYKLALITSQMKPGHRYSVRATIHDGEQMLFTSTRHYGVEPTQSSSVHIQVEPVVPRNQPEAEEQDYYGQLICSSCPAEDVHIGLKADQSFVLVSSTGEQVAFGGWRQQGPILLLTASTGPQYWFQRHQDGLEPLLVKGEAKLPTPALLHKAPMPELDIAMELVGDYRYMADAAMFQECVTGKRWPVAQDAGGLRLEQAYLDQRTGPGEPLTMRVKGQLKLMPGMESGSEVETLRVTELLEVAQLGTTCD